MNKKPNLFRNAGCGFLAAWLGLAASAQADLLVSFPFNEGSGTNVVDTAQNLQGFFGYRHDPAVDTVTLTPNGPSTLPGDNAATLAGNAYLLVEDSPSPVLAITNGPITIECWVNIDFYANRKRVEGLVGYGDSFKMGLMGGRQVFTLLGVYDITNTAPGAVLEAGVWNHVVAAWEPGVGVHFYVNGVSNFTAHTAMTARPPRHNLLTIGSENLANNLAGSFDRVRIHNALLTYDQLDVDIFTPKAPLASTVLAYDFNETSLPCQSAVGPARPAVPSHQIAYKFNSPKWTSDTPTGLSGDYALAFNTNLNYFKEWVQVNYEGEMIPLGVGTTNFTLQAWVKLPTDGIDVKRTIFRAPTNAPRVSMAIAANRTMIATLLGNTDFGSSVRVPNDGRWHHLAVAMEDFARMKFYLDGVLRQTMNRTATGKPNNGTGPNMLIGQESDTYYYQGLLDRVRINDVALGEGQLDFPAIPGQATITVQPADTVANTAGTAQFTATVSSPTEANYQWFYRANRPDIQGVPVPGATSPTLELSGITAKDQGFYFLRITNTAGVTESYAAQLLVRTGASLDLNGFESPRYKSGPLEDQDFWTNDQNGNVVRVQTAEEIEAALKAAGLTPGQTVRSGTQALLITGTGVGTTSIRPVVGFETEQKVTVEFWARPLARGTTALTTNNSFVTVDDSAGNRGAAIRFGGSVSIDYNSANAWVPTGKTWNENTWYKFTLKMDYTAKTYHVLVDDVKVNANPIPFYSATASSFGQIRLWRGASNAGMIVDDITASTASTPVKILGITKSNGNINLSWEGGVPPYQLQRCADLSTGTWEDVGNPTTEPQGTDTIGNGSMFYRVVSN